MRAAPIVLVGLLQFAFASQASSAQEQRLSVESSIRHRPTVNVFLGEYLLAGAPLFAREYALEWTANGRSMPSNLNGVAKCIYGSAQRYSCGALTNWFGDPPRNGGRKAVSSELPEAFYLPDMDFDTEYCFRFKDQLTPWSKWSCARTPPAPARPAAPGIPQLTFMAADTGKGTSGSGHPAQVLVEWDRLADETLTVGYRVELQKDGAWVAAQGDIDAAEHPDYEKTVELPRDADPDKTYAFRVCAYNISGGSCSEIARTSGITLTGRADPDRRGGGAADELGKLPKPQDAPVPAKAKVKLPQPSGPPLPICDAARVARERNSPAAPGLEAQCRVLQAQGAGGPSADDLAAKGEIIANGNPLSAELRDQQTEGPVRRGFDIGMAAADGQTSWGPGKQKMLESLGADEQEGFKVATAFSLDRNRNAALAATGAAIAAADPGVAEARNADPDGRYRLGFDIATGIFGDPAQGARGNTATGPGSLAIRDALSAPAQRGFDASVQLHLSRR